MIKPSVNETKWSSFLARTRALILFISIWIFDFGPVKLPGLSRNGPQPRRETHAGYFLLFSCYLKSFWQPWVGNALRNCSLPIDNLQTKITQTKSPVPWLRSTSSRSSFMGHSLTKMKGKVERNVHYKTLQYLKKSPSIYLRESSSLPSLSGP